ncbi:MAG: hypothetical protein WC942_04860 [Clostridia bacterium]|jgi:hypothetical protein
MDAEQVNKYIVIYHGLTHCFYITEAVIEEKGKATISIDGVSHTIDCEKVFDTLEGAQQFWKDKINERIGVLSGQIAQFKHQLEQGPEEYKAE